tara:strand:- start:1082 stop:2248 length:1167 start_codon:yes stop_codon:yes gene_type:complete
MNQLTTTNKHFTVETSIMEKIFDASGYHFHVLTIDGHKCWILKELAHAFGYSKASNMLQAMGKNTNRIRLTKNKRGEGIPNTISLAGLTELKKILMDSDVFLKKTSKTCWTERNIEKTHIITLIREDTLQEFLTLYARKPNAKEVGKKLYDYLSQVNIVLPTVIEQPLDEVEQMIMKLYPSHSKSIEVSKEIQQHFKDLVKHDPGYFMHVFPNMKTPIYVNLMMGYHTASVSTFIPNKKSVKKQVLEQGFSTTLMQSFRNFLAFICPASRGALTLMDRAFIEKFNLSVEQYKSKGLSHINAIKQTVIGKGKIKNMVVEIENEIDFLFQSLYWLKYKGLLEEAHQQFLNDNKYVTKQDRALKSFLHFEKWEGIPLLEQRLQQRLIGTSE